MRCKEIPGHSCPHLSLWASSGSRKILRERRTICLTVEIHVLKRHQLCLRSDCCPNDARLKGREQLRPLCVRWVEALIHDCRPSDNLGRELGIGYIATNDIDPIRNVSVATTIDRDHMLASDDKVLHQSKSDRTRTKHNLSQVSSIACAGTTGSGCRDLSSRRTTSCPRP